MRPATVAIPGVIGLSMLIVLAERLAGGCARAPTAGDPIDGLTAAEHDQFEQGRIEFQRVFDPGTGLGPTFNTESCAECHESPVAGGSGDEIEIHVGAYLPDESLCDPLIHRGGPVIQQRATPAVKEVLGIDREPVPEEATAIARRTTPDVFGFGLLDAVPDSTILALADSADRNGDGISGRVNRSFDGRLGRFGRKAVVAQLSDFNHGAFVVEQGITNPAIPSEETIGGQPIPEGVDPVPEPEISQAAIDLTDAFVRFLAPPPPKRLSAAAKAGRKILTDIGCTACHVPTLMTGDHPVRALRYKQVAAYTDLLLHDMGRELADICFGLATPSEFRTEPLMGLRFSEEITEGEPRFLHDGRARSIEEAIELHGGEGTASRQRFMELTESDRQALLEFLRSL